MKIKRLIATIAASAAVLAGGAIAAAPANAAAAPAVIGSGTAGGAQIVTYGSPYRVNLGGGHCAVFMYYDYNWWEEVFLGKRDGAVYQYRVLC